MHVWLKMIWLLKLFDPGARARFALGACYDMKMGENIQMLAEFSTKEPLYVHSLTSFSWGSASALVPRNLCYCKIFPPSFPFA